MAVLIRGKTDGSFPSLLPPSMLLEIKNHLFSAFRNPRIVQLKSKIKSSGSAINTACWVGNRTELSSPSLCKILSL